MADRSVHRAIHWGNRGADVKRLQQGLNKIVDAHEFDWRRIEADGETGLLTRKVATLAAFAIGLSEGQVGRIHKDGTFTQHAQRHLRGDVPRSEAMKRRKEERKPRLKSLHEKHREAAEKGPRPKPAGGRAFRWDGLRPLARRHLAAHP